MLYLAPSAPPSSPIQPTTAPLQGPFKHPCVPESRSNSASNQALSYPAIGFLIEFGPSPHHGTPNEPGGGPSIPAAVPCLLLDYFQCPPQGLSTSSSRLSDVLILSLVSVLPCAVSSSCHIRRGQGIAEERHHALLRLLLSAFLTFISQSAPQTPVHRL